MSANQKPSIRNPKSFVKLVGQLRDVIRDARQKALRAVDLVQVRTCWESEASRKIAATDVLPREFVRDPVMLEFLGMPNTGKLLEPGVG
ncbi:MAG: hypothetical protein C0404_08130 [Verrucomicrobia bacterium]|nr:hypothetical protein [Verrucomicrobiota bacterium]